MKIKLEDVIKKMVGYALKIKEEAKAKFGINKLTASQFAFLENIHELESPTLSELAYKLEITKPSTTIMISKLDKMGYIKKIRSTEDRRATHIQLTKKGKKAADLNQKVFQETIKSLTSNLKKGEKKMLSNLLSKCLK